MDPNSPIVIGLAGQAGSGKTVTADALAPTAQVITNTCSCSHQESDHQEDIDGSPCVMCDCNSFNYGGSIHWTHLFFALPIYRIVTARQKIAGDNSRNRILYEVHEGIVDIFGRSPLYSPIKNYDDLIALVKYVSSIPCEPEGEKARTFMQEFGSLCREYDEDIFINWMRRKIQEEYREFKKEYTEDRYPGLKCGVVISDVRFVNEAEMISSHPNGSLYGLTATPEVLRARLENRDGKALTPEQASHPSENSIRFIPEDTFTRTIDTSSFSVSEQVQHVRELITEEYKLFV